MYNNQSDPLHRGAPGSFKDIFLLKSNIDIPKSWVSAVAFCGWLAINNPIYYKATERTVAHFITDIEFPGSDGTKEERDDLRNFAVEEVGALDELKLAGIEGFVYGNGFLRIHKPFDRFLIDRRGGRRREYAIESFGSNATFDLSTMTYTVPDPTRDKKDYDPEATVSLPFFDRASKDRKRIALRRIDPRWMLVNQNWSSGRKEFYWIIEEHVKAAVKSSTDLLAVRDLPRSILEAIRDGKDFKFNDGAIFHIHNDIISGYSWRGLGIPNILTNYNPLRQIQMGRSVNESISETLLEPLRVISPPGNLGTNTADAASGINLTQFRDATQAIIRQHRLKPGQVYSAPFPLQYQEFGGNGRQFFPLEYMQYNQNEMLQGMGYPQEFWNFTMQSGQMPTAVRLFESQHIPLKRQLNNAVKWFISSVLGYLGKDQIEVKLQDPSIADDAENKHVLLQLAAGGMVSLQTAYKNFGINNPMSEIENRTKEDAAIQLIKQKEGEEMEQQMQLGDGKSLASAMMQPPPGAAPPAGGGASMYAPIQGGNSLDLDAQAQELAQQMLQIPDDGERRVALNEIRGSNPTLHMLVKSYMDKIRNQAASEGRKSVTAQ